MPRDFNLLDTTCHRALAEQFVRLQSADSTAEAREKLTTLLNHPSSRDPMLLGEIRWHLMMSDLVGLSTLW